MMGTGPRGFAAPWAPAAPPVPLDVGSGIPCEGDGRAFGGQIGSKYLENKLKKLQPSKAENSVPVTEHDFGINIKSYGTHRRVCGGKQAHRQHHSLARRRVDNGDGAPGLGGYGGDVGPGPRVHNGDRFPFPQRHRRGSCKQGSGV